MPTEPAVRAARAYIDEHFAAFERTLVDLARIPSVSATGFPPERVRESAEAVARVLAETGLENVEVLELGVPALTYRLRGLVQVDVEVGCLERPPMSDFLGGAPCLLTGVEDPGCGARSENEGLHLGDWRKCMRAAVRLYDELSRTLAPE